MFELRDRRMAQKIMKRLTQLKCNVTLMHVCGGHQDTLVRYGIEGMMREAGVDIRQGPGCPVCVTPPRELEEVMLLAEKGKIITVFGDMMRVPGEERTLFDMKSHGADVRMVYSIDDAVQIAEGLPNEQVVFMAIGFETTAPSTASVILRPDLPNNFSIYCTHRTVPPALKFLVELGELGLNGLIEPGHVSAIIGTKPYEFLTNDYGIPQVVAGFEPLDLMMSIYSLVRMIDRGEKELFNNYERAVGSDGNLKALEMMNQVFAESDSEWRGFGLIPKSGLSIKPEFSHLDAKIRFKSDLEEIKDRVFKEPKGCRCGEVLRGLIFPEECPLFRKVCNPSNPIGPCMVTSEGSCNIKLKYG